MKITIDPGPPIVVDPEDAPIYKNGSDEADWHCKNDCDFSVDFDNGSPFKDGHFDHGKHNSGPVRGDAKVGDSFKYTVTVGTQKRDPTIIVKG